MIEPLEMLDAYGDGFVLDLPVRGGFCQDRIGKDGLCLFREEKEVLYALTREHARRIRDWLSEYLKESEER